MSKNYFRCSINHNASNRHIKKDTILTNKNNLYKSDCDTKPTDLCNTCRKSAYQKATVNVPVAVKPFSFIGPTKTSCSNEPVIEEMFCKNHCDKQICYFTISQEICVEIPVYFGANASAGKSWVECHEASTEDCEEYK
ncbi:MAG: hypothetical protein PHF24_09245 [Syntrophomonas sp.]|nr:hypothetical protein [Syntrophomonas sp.]